MSRREILKLVAGFRKFRDKYFADEHPLYQRLTSGVGQTPKTLLIGCSDSRVDPAIITSASPGELFIVLTVGTALSDITHSDGGQDRENALGLIKFVKWKY